MKKHLSLLLIVSLLLLVACSNQDKQEPQGVDNSEVEASGDEFVADYDWALAFIKAVNQDNEETTIQKYQGKPWIMNMIFTNCTTVCLPMSANMAKLQSMLKETDLDYHLVSYSVDPEVDTPEVLKEYAANYEADLTTWDFLTGYTMEDIQKLAKSVKTLVEKQEGNDQVGHSTKFFLINQQGIAVKGYDGVNPPFEEMIQDLENIQ